MLPNVMTSQASRIMLDALQSEGKHMLHGFPGDWDKVYDELPTKLKAMIKSNLLEWYASELAKPYTDDFKGTGGHPCGRKMSSNARRSCRHTDLKSRLLGRTYRPLASILALPQIAEPD